MFARFLFMYSLYLSVCWSLTQNKNKKNNKTGQLWIGEKSKKIIKEKMDRIETKQSKTKRGCPGGHGECWEHHQVAAPGVCRGDHEEAQGGGNS